MIVFYVLFPFSFVIKKYEQRERCIISRVEGYMRGKRCEANIVRLSIFCIISQCCVIRDFDFARDELVDVVIYTLYILTS